MLVNDFCSRDNGEALVNKHSKSEGSIKIYYSLRLKKKLQRQKMTIKIPNYKTLTLTHIVLDYNGTIAKDGVLKEEVIPLLQKLTSLYSVHVITADTFGSVAEQMRPFTLTIKVLESNNHTEEKQTYVTALGAQSCVAIGNGNNDVSMIKEAEVGIALLGDEGCSSKTIQESDIVCNSIKSALELFIHTKRLIATLRA